MGAGTEWLAVQRGGDGGGWRAVDEAAAHPEAGSRRSVNESRAGHVWVGRRDSCC